MYLGLDLGTSGLRGLLVDDNGQAIAEAESHYDVDAPQSGWREQDPTLWIEACKAVFAALKTRAPEAFSGLKGIGVAGHMHGAVTLDGDGAPIRPAILWNDTRASDAAARLDGMSEFRDVSGNIVFAGFTAPKLLWMKTHEPENFARVKTVMLPKDYVNYWLSGVMTSEMSDAAGTAWLSTRERAWSETLLAASEMRLEQMPKLVEGSDVAGHIRAELAHEYGLPSGCVIAGGAGDNAAAACGVGALEEGDGFVSLGTSGVLLAARDRYAPAPDTAVHTFCHALPGTWYQMGVFLAATDCLNWLGRITGETPAALAGHVDRLEAPSGLIFLPYLSGERTPHNDTEIRGAFIGLDAGHDQKAMTKAVMEGVAFAVRDNLVALQKTGAKFDRLLGIGGGMRSRYWVELIATVLDTPVVLPQAGEFGAALGAARLAMVAAGAGDAKSVMTKPETGEIIEPDAGKRDAYMAAYDRFRAAYPAVKGL